MRRQLPLCSPVDASPKGQRLAATSGARVFRRLDLLRGRSLGPPWLSEWLVLEGKGRGVHVGASRRRFCSSELVD